MSSGGCIFKSIARVLTQCRTGEALEGVARRAHLNKPSQSSLKLIRRSLLTSHIANTASSLRS